MAKEEGNEGDVSCDVFMHGLLHSQIIYISRYANLKAFLLLKFDTYNLPLLRAALNIQRRANGQSIFRNLEV